MPTTELFVVDSAGVTKRVSELSAWFYQYKKQIAAGNMDPSMPRLSVDATHPVVTAARRRSGKQRRSVKLPQPTNPLLVWQMLYYPPLLVVLDGLVSVPHWLVLGLPRRVAAWDQQMLVVGVI